ncbi:MAG TPA: glycosyltransferase family 4 protein [Anaerolineae bacterium]|nr:glycosyltransferase family 4 protein [Anaerolineae bacterium]
MKIACITTSQIPSSSANSIQAMKVCHSLRQLDNEIQVWVPKFQTTSWKDLSNIYGLSTQFGIDWLKFNPSLKQYDFCWKAVHKSIQWGAEVIYTWALQAAVFSLLRKKSVIMEFHDFPMGFLGPKLFRIFMRLSGKKLVLTTTRALATRLEEEYKISFPPQILQIAPNGTDLESYSNLPDPVNARKKIGLKECLTVVFTGHFYKGRGMDLLLELAKSLPEINFLCVGGRQEDIEPWKKRLRSLDIKNITLTGFVPNSKLPLYQAAGDILVMPYGKAIAGSSGGNIAKVINPMKMFDYLATGRAIVSSDLPIFHEILNKDNAVFCPPENTSAWIHVIKALSEDQHRRTTLGKRAKQDAAQYTWIKRSKRTLEMYTILKKSGAL